MRFYFFDALFSIVHQVMKIDRSLSALLLETCFLSPLGIDPSSDYSTRQVKGYFYTKAHLKSAPAPKLLALSTLPRDFGLLQSSIRLQPNAPQLLSASTPLPNSVPIAHNYCGYQFGNWAAQLGDGRAMTVGHSYDHKKGIHQFQFKGSGLTTFSRRGDGLAVLRSSVRQFLASQYMHSLGIPTTRAFSLATTGQKAVRDPLYSGRIIEEPCAVVLRVSPSFIRFGSFEVCNKGNPPAPSYGLQSQMIPRLANFVISNFYPQLNKKQSIYQLFYEQVVRRSAQLVAKWQVYGFVHGVLNTDNMSILGLTIDYGPFAFMDRFDPGHISNHSDKEGRYSYQNQPQVFKWNLQRLGEALVVVLPLKTSRLILKETFQFAYWDQYYKMAGTRLGLEESQSSHIVVDLFFKALAATHSRFNESFLAVQQYQLKKIDQQTLRSLLKELSASKLYILAKRKPTLGRAQISKYKDILKNHPVQAAMIGLSQETIFELEDRVSKYEKLKESPYDAGELWQPFIRALVEAKSRMNLEETVRSNPRHNLCNYVLQNCVAGEQKGVAESQRMIDYLFGNQAWQQHWQANRQEQICISCSS